MNNLEKIKWLQILKVLYFIVKCIIKKKVYKIIDSNSLYYKLLH